MIIYYKGAFGLNLLWRLRGSAVYRAMIPGLISVAFFLCIRLWWGPYSQSGTSLNDPDAEKSVEHPYAIGVLVTSVSFLIIFRANHGYGRYWEACGAVHQMMSKWMDATTHTAVFHLQCDHYAHIKPPSFFDYPELNGQFLTRARERYTDHDGNFKKNLGVTGELDEISDFNMQASTSTLVDVPTRLRGVPRYDGGWKGLFPHQTGKNGKHQSSTFFNPDLPWNSDGKGFASTAGGRTPSLFLQELAHLASLLNAVALSTLRNDIDGAESPLDIYEPGAAWPEADPDKRPDSKKSWSEIAKYITGRDRSPETRTAYNASRPLSVIGGVSNAEIRFLQMARGPLAKTQLCWQWLSELVMREHLAGSTGKVGPPIMSRIVQFLSDGNIGYNHARKIMYIPFPFPSAQISMFYVIAMVFAIPLLMDQYAAEAWLGSVLTFLTTTCLVGLHEVARELENPFRNVPNDLPVCTFQAQFNESLLTMFSGYHPDLYWDPNRHRKSACSTKNMSTQETIPEGVSENGSSSFKTEKQENDATGDSLNLQALIETQGREIERLRKLVEGDKTKGD